MQNELTDLEEEVTYLKVKLRKERVVSRSDYMDVRDRLEDLRSRVNGTDSNAGRYGSGTRSSDPAVESSQSSVDTAAPGTIPSGTEIDVRLETALSSNTNQVEDRFEGTTVVDLRQNGRVLIPAGSRVRGVVTAVREAGRVDRKGSLSLSFDEITLNGRNQPIRGSVTRRSRAAATRKTPARSAPAPRWAAFIGGILGGLKGAAVGVLIGGGGVVAATEGKDVELRRAPCFACARRAAERARDLLSPQNQDTEDAETSRTTAEHIRRSNAKGAFAGALIVCAVGPRALRPARRRRCAECRRGVWAPGDEPGFELRRRQIDATLEHRAEERAKRRRIRGHGRLEIAHARRREERRNHRAERVDLDRDACFAGRIGQA